MKILFVNKFFFPHGGAEVSLFETEKILRDKGHKVVNFSMKHPMNFSSDFDKYFVSYIDYEKEGIKNEIKASFRLLYSFEAKRKIERLIRDEKPDIVHLNNIYHQISPSIIHSVKKFKIPLVMSLRDYKLICASYHMLHDGNVCEACSNGKYYNCFFKKCVKNSRIKSLLNTIEMYLHHNILHIYDLIDVFISPSKFLKTKIEENGFKGKIYYLPNFVITSSFKPKYDWQENSIVYFGTLTKQKGLFTLIEAVKDLNVKLKIIGEGPLHDALINKVAVERLRNIVFLGYMNAENLAKEIYKSKFVVLPSEWYENNPRTIIESFALGKPVIGSRIGGIPELIKDNLTGLTFNTGNADDLRSGIEYLLKNQHKISNFGIRARKFIEENLNEEKHYEKLMEIYSNAIDKNNQ